MKNNKPTGFFKFCLACDCETTGVARGSLDPTTDQDTGKYYQAISFAFIVVNTQTLEEVEELYLEIQWDGKSEWSLEAEKVHGLSKEYLAQNGITEEEAVCLIGDLIIRYFGPESTIPLLGHNVATFDRYFLDKMFRKHGIILNFGNRHIDTLPVGFTLFNLYHSDQIFSHIGLPERTQHNALEDIKYTIEVIRTSRALWDAFVKPQLES